VATIDDVERTIGPPVIKGKRVERGGYRETPDGYVVFKVLFDSFAQRRNVTIEVAGGYIWPCFDLNPERQQKFGLKEMHPDHPSPGVREFARRTDALSVSISTVPTTTCAQFVTFQEEK
jgi:hypothetical protein